MTEKLMNVREVAEYLRVSETAIYRYIKSERIPFTKIGGKYLFRMSSINEHLKNSEVKKS